MQELLWFEAIFKGAVALFLIVMPLSLTRILGLHRPEQRFWPRLAGFLLLGISAGVLVTLLFPAARGGIGVAGLLAINLAGAAALVVPLIWGTAAPERRGRLLIVLTTIALLTLAFIEIAHI